MLAIPGYDTMHHRIKAARGSARNQICIVCGEAAQEWACIRNAIVLERRYGANVAYSGNIEDYDPMCIRCHREFDAPKKPRGEDNYGAVLTTKIVNLIRQNYAATRHLPNGSRFSFREAAGTLGVSKETIYAAMVGYTWAHLPSWESYLREGKEKRRRTSMKQVYVLIIHHRHGSDVGGVFELEQETEKALYVYVCSQWDDEIQRRDVQVPAGISTDIAAYSEEAAVRLYFGEIVDDEYYEVKAAPYFPAGVDLHLSSSK
jgi:hypothetical protein